MGKNQVLDNLSTTVKTTQLFVIPQASNVQEQQQKKTPQILDKKRYMAVWSKRRN